MRERERGREGDRERERERETPSKSIYSLYILTADAMQTTCLLFLFISYGVLNDNGSLGLHI